MDLKEIGNFIASLRKENNLTQEELGEKLGITNKTISREHICHQQIYY